MYAADAITARPALPGAAEASLISCVLRCFLLLAPASRLTPSRLRLLPGGGVHLHALRQLREVLRELRVALAERVRGVPRDGAAPRRRRIVGSRQVTTEAVENKFAHHARCTSTAAKGGPKRLREGGLLLT